MKGNLHYQRKMKKMQGQTCDSLMIWFGTYSTEETFNLDVIPLSCQQKSLLSPLKGSTFVSNSCLTCYNE